MNVQFYPRHWTWIFLRAEQPFKWPFTKKENSVWTPLKQVLVVCKTRVSIFLWFEHERCESRPFVIKRVVSKSNFYQITDDWKLRNKVETHWGISYFMFWQNDKGLYSSIQRFFPTAKCDIAKTWHWNTIRYTDSVFILVS